MSEARLTIKRLGIMHDALSQHYLRCGDEPKYWGNSYIIALEGAMKWCSAELRKRGAELVERDGEIVLEEASQMARRTAEEYITVKDFLRQLDGKLSSGFVYKQIAAGSIPSIRIGGRILIPSDALDLMLTAQADKDLEEGTDA